MTFEKSISLPGQSRRSTGRLFVWVVLLWCAVPGVSRAQICRYVLDEAKNNYSKGLYEQTIATLEECLPQFESEVKTEAYHLLARSYYYEQRPQRAREYIRELMQTDPSFRPALDDPEPFEDWVADYADSSFESALTLTLESELEMWKEIARENASVSDSLRRRILLSDSTWNAILAHIRPPRATQSFVYTRPIQIAYTVPTTREGAPPPVVPLLKRINWGTVSAAGASLLAGGALVYLIAQPGVEPNLPTPPRFPD